MKRASAARLFRGKGRRAHYLLRLFMAGNGANSRQALSNLRSLCREHLKGHFTIETIDVVKNFEAAVKDNILVTPALILIAPRPRVTVLGNLSDRQKVLFALRLSDSDS
jgi:circadian clock protein KaiB